MLRVIHMSEPGPAIAKDGVAQFEASLGKTLPAPYREFLLTANGGRPGKANRVLPLPERGTTTLQALYGIGEGPFGMATKLENMRRREGDHYLEDVIPIGHDDGGNRIVLAVSGDQSGAVYFQALDEHPSRRNDTEWYRTRQFVRVADSFGAFLDSLCPV